MKFWDRVERTLVGLLGLCALIVALWQVIGRYLTPAHAISYAEETIVYLVIWAVMIVSSQLVRSDGHVRPDLVLRILPQQAARWMEVFNCLVAIVFSAALVWYGGHIVLSSIQIEERSSSDLQFPMWIYYLALPTGGALMAVRYVIRLFRYIFHYDPATMAPGHGTVHETVGGLQPPKPG
jgi:C4-dicarboxylate transporter DctQ subunit